MNKLINLVSNSNFEKFKYDSIKNKPNNISIDSWSPTNEKQINGKTAYHGSYSMNLKTSKDAGGYSIMSLLKDKINPKHVYYFRIACTLPKNASFNEKISVNLAKSIVIPIYTDEIELTLDAFKNWNYYSNIITINSSSEPQDMHIWLKQLTNNNMERCSVDCVQLIDLTAVFGDGGEPSKYWCDECIPYFENEYDMGLLSKNIEFTCKDLFVYDNYTKKYYTDNYSPKITFLIRNIDNYYNIEDNKQVVNKIKLEWITYNIDGLISTTQLSINELQVDYIDNFCYVSYEGFKFNKETVHHVTLKIYSDLSAGIRVEDELTIYFIGNYNTLEYNLDYDLSFASTYLRKLKGTTNAYNDVPTNIDVYINGVKTSPVDILNQDDKLTVFEKELYLNDGNNNIDVVATDICGNSVSKSFSVFVDCMPPKPEKVALLENFIGNDDDYIDVRLGNAKLKYENKHAGLEKNMILDTSVDSHYFILSGENSNLYRISKNNIPKIQGDIIKRPLAITFDYVEKIYDGNTDITKELEKLQLDDGYYFHNINKEYNDYANTGVVRGTKERRITSATVFSKDEFVNHRIIIESPNVDLKNVYIDIDGTDGYSMLCSDNEAEFIFDANDNNNLHEHFERVILYRENNNTILDFIYINDNDCFYKVKNSINLKYNYAIDSKINYVTYTDSDIGMIGVEFNNAFFKTKNVTTGIQPITCNKIKFNGDMSENYQISNYTAYGKILKRTIYPYIKCLDKVYDGSTIIPFEMYDSYYNGLKNSISGDDIYIDNTFEGDRTSNTHIFTKNGSTVFVVDTPDVGENKLAQCSSICLEGYDANNYILGDIGGSFKINIFERPINIKIDKIRLLRATKQWEVDYTVINDIKTDKITMIYNSNDNLNIKVYGGIDEDGNSIHLDYNKHLDILSLFFNYRFTTDYEFKIFESEVEKIVENKKIIYWKDEALPAEPNSERFNIESKYNTKYPGEVKHTIKPLSDGARIPYFESEDRRYKLYSGCKVMVTNINLNPLNSKSKNYKLLNSTYETEIEII